MPSASANAKKNPQSDATPKLPPYAKAARYLSQSQGGGPLTVTVLTGSMSMDAAGEIEARERKLSRGYAIRRTPMAALPYRRDPDRYDWSFLEALPVAVVSGGYPERDDAVLGIAEAALAARCAIVCCKLSDGRVEMFKPAEQEGLAWQL